MDVEQVRRIEDRHVIPFYVKRPIAIVRGRGAIAWDSEGREYIDFVAGYGAALLGHCHPEVVEAVKRQAERLINCPYMFYNDARAEAVQRLVEATPDSLTRVFLSNSGTEAVECGLKLARLHTGRKKFVAAVRGFHGRTMGSLSLTWNPHYRKPFEPLVPGVRHVPFGDEEALKEAVDDDVAAVVLEPVQGEGGVYPAPEGYLKAARDVCDDAGALLMFDEVQTGLGRTGRMWAFEHWGVEPDILCLAKGLGGGLPIGATVTTEEVSKSTKPGIHGTTYGGNPLSCAAAAASLRVIVEGRLWERASAIGREILNGLMEIRDENREIIREVRGLGLMVAVQFRLPVASDIVEEAMRMGVLLLKTSRTIVRMLPPLVVEEWQVERVLDVLREVVGKRGG